MPGYFSSDEEIQLHNAQMYQQQNVPIFMTTYPQRGSGHYPARVPHQQPFARSAVYSSDLRHAQQQMEDADDQAEEVEAEPAADWQQFDRGHIETDDRRDVREEYVLINNQQNRSQRPYSDIGRDEKRHCKSEKKTRKHKSHKKHKRRRRRSYTSSELSSSSESSSSQTSSSESFSDSSSDRHRRKSKSKKHKKSAKKQRKAKSAKKHAKRRDTSSESEKKDELTWDQVTKIVKEEGLE